MGYRIKEKGLIGRFVPNWARYKLDPLHMPVRLVFDLTTRQAGTLKLIIVIYDCSNLVPGSGNSLDVVDASNSSCNTNGRTLRLWLNETHIETAPECYTNQFR